MEEEYLIVSDPEICGGKPVVKGTRVPAQYLVELWSKGFDADYIHEQYPTVTKELVEKVIKALGESRLMKVSG